MNSDEHRNQIAGAGAVVTDEEIDAISLEGCNWLAMGEDFWPTAEMWRMQDRVRRMPAGTPTSVRACCVC